MVAILQAIDDKARERARWRMTVADIQAAAAIKHRSTVDRGIRQLKKLGVLEVSRTAYGAWYGIQWETLSMLVSCEASRDSAPIFGKSRHHAESRVGTVRRESRHHAERESAPCGVQDTAQAHNPPPPALDAWAEAEAMLRELEVGTAGECIAACQARGDAPEDVRALITEYARDVQRGKWISPGAIWWRLTRGTWPKVSESYERGEQRAARQQADEAKAIAERVDTEASERDRQAAVENERHHGAAVDALTDDEARAIIEAMGNQFLVAEFKKRGRSSLTIRAKLLNAVRAAR